MPGTIEAMSCIAISVPELYVAVSHHTIAKVLIPLPNTERNCPMISKKKANSISRKEHDLRLKNVYELRNGHTLPASNMVIISAECVFLFCYAT
jgi:hypothetical protein